MSAAPSSTLRRDLVNAYLAAASKIFSGVVVWGILYRLAGRNEFAFFALVRGTLGVLHYITFGLSPAILHLAPQAMKRAEEQAALPTDVTTDAPVLQYEPRDVAPVDVIYSSAVAVTALSMVVGLAIVMLYTLGFGWIYPSGVRREHEAILLIGFGLLSRLAGDMPGAVSQSNGRFAPDAQMVCLGEVTWPLLTLLLIVLDQNPLMAASAAYFISGVAAVALRFVVAYPWLTGVRPALARWRTMATLLGFGLLVTVSQLADFLYAPVDYLLIGRFLGSPALAAYAPAVQIDAGLLLLVGGLAAVLLPKTAAAHAAGDVARIRRYYIKGTLLSASMLLMGAVLIYLASPLMFRLWFGNPMYSTQAILPLVFVHTVLGGSSSVGRSILLGMGKVKAFTAAALIAGLANVLLSYCFVKYLGLGLPGIIYGTILVVFVRCALWMPWYVLRSIKTMQNITIAPETPIDPLTPSPA